MSYQTRKSGREAEERVFYLASQLGVAVMATPEQDYSKKIDVILDGHLIQVSSSSKSKRQRNILEKRGIVNIPAGEHISDFFIINLLRKLIELN